MPQTIEINRDWLTGASIAIPVLIFLYCWGSPVAKYFFSQAVLRWKALVIIVAIYSFCAGITTFVMDISPFEKGNVYHAHKEMVEIPSNINNREQSIRDTIGDDIKDLTVQRVAGYKDQYIIEYKKPRYEYPTAHTTFIVLCGIIFLVAWLIPEDEL